MERNSQKIYSAMEDDKVSPEKNKKRPLKTPAQVKALEQCYNDHKFPSKVTKSQLAEQIGLTEKQVSSWFCRRRSKHKRLSRDKLGRGLRQESCGSTNHVYLRLDDPREAESGQPSLDASSESSSSQNDALEAKKSGLALMPEKNKEAGPETIQFLEDQLGIIETKAKMQRSLLDMLAVLIREDTTNMLPHERAARASLMVSIGKCLENLD